MDKSEFIIKLINLTKLNRKDDAIRYYEELIDERIESGEDEKEIIHNLGDVNEIANVIIIEGKLENDKKPNIVKSLVAMTTVLLVISSPILIPLLFAGIMIIIAMFLVLFALAITFGAILLTCLIIPFAVIYELIVGTITITGALLTIGLTLITISIIYYMTKFCFFLTNSLSNFIIRKVLKKTKNFKSKKRGEINE